MSTIILYTLLLALIQIWLLPMAINMKHFSYLLSNRDGEQPTSPLSQRVARASANLQESLPAFLALCLLAMIVEAEVTTAATIWLGLRVAYLVCYSLGIPLLRSAIWISSIGCMLWMALQIA
jgi:uncharacterized MAPEG superfamily protein